VTIDTSALKGTSGFVSLQFNPGAIPDTQPGDLTLTDFVSAGGTLELDTTTDGGAEGGLSGGAQIANNSTLDRLTQAFTFGTALSFDVRIDGPAVTQPGHGLFGSTFALQLLAPDRVTPELTTDTSGAVMTIDVRPDGTTDTATFGPVSVAAINTAVVKDAPI